MMGNAGSWKECGVTMRRQGRNVASGNVSSECGVRMRRLRWNVASGNVSSECGVRWAWECGVRECSVRTRRQEGMWRQGRMWRQGMCRQNVASEGNVASRNVSSECGVRGMRRQGERQAPKCYTMRGHLDFYYFYYIILFVMTSLLWRSCDYYPCRLSLFQVDCDLFGRSFPNFIKIHQNSTLSLRLTASTILICKAEFVGPLQKL